jgi:MFS family permease
MYSNNYKRYVTVLLLLVYIFNQVDRAIFGIVMEAIKREFALSDTQLGFVGGFALFFFYALLGIPVARWADRSHRVNIMSAAIALWSGVVTISAAVTSFWQFALARVGVGIGEAGFSAVAQSVLTDYHPNSSAERTRALSIFMLALPLGPAVSNLMGGWINEGYGWRAAFLAAGAPGLLLALMMKLTVREPPRTLSGRQADAPAVRPPLSAVFATLWRRRSLRHLTVGMTLLTLITGGVLGWQAPFFIRSHGMSTGELGTWLAINAGVGGSIGVWLSGNLSRRFRMDDERRQAQFLAAISVLAWPLLLALFLSPLKTSALLLSFAATLLVNFFFAPSFSLVQALSTPSMRATVVAVVILSQTLVAGALGLQFIGIVSDALTGRFGEDALRWSLVALTPAALWAGLHFWLAARSIKQDLATLALDEKQAAYALPVHSAKDAHA